MIKKVLSIFPLAFIQMRASIRSLLSLALLLCFSNGYALSIIVNESVVSSPASEKELRNIFTLQKTHWNNGNKIVIFVFPDNHPLHRQFSKTITKIFPHQYRRIWDRISFSGTGIAPVVVSNEKEMLKKVSQTKNSIGYIEIATEYQNIKEINLNLSGERLHE